MKKNLSIALSFLLLTGCTIFGEKDRLLMWYDQPAALWVEALPLGNGRLGAMVYGNPVNEELQLNEETIWGGSPYNNTNPLAKDALPEIRRLIFEGKNAQAQALGGKTIIAPGVNGSNGVYGMPYQTIGSLKLDFEGMQDFNEYYRELDIDRAIAKTTFKVDGVEYTREVFTSFADQLVIMRISSSKKGSISFSSKFTTPYKDAVRSIDNQMLRLDAKTSDHEGIEGKVRFTTLAKFDNEGGSLEVLSDSTLKISGADQVTVYISTGTNFINYQDISGDAEKVAKEYMAQAGTKSFKQYVSDHVNLYATYFNRVSLDLGKSDQNQKPINQRVEEFASSFDPQLAALYFQFGRYLLICSSQPDGQAPGLQGIWNYRLRAPWDGKYTININTEMNYWPAEITNLAELHEPMIQLIRDVSQTGKETAAMYGVRGWALHHNTDIWRSTGAVDGPRYGVWPTSNAWFCQHLWDRYLFSGDSSYLESVYPIMKEATKFYIDFLVREPKHGWLVVAPSYSPENAPSFKGKRSWVLTHGTTMDNQMVFDLFSNTIEAGKLLADNELYLDSLKTVLDQLAPMQIGKYGQLQEWIEDWDNPRDRHRHISHVWGLYPGYQINPYDTPELYEAVKTTLTQRGDASTSWSMGWKICSWARLLDGDHAYKLLQDHIKPTYEETGQNGGTYPNLFSAHPPFQIDGNFGATAGIAEMLLQSHAGAVHVLPALPQAWATGSVKGLRARGGFEIVEMSWKNHQIEKLVIKSTIGGTLRLRSADELKTKEGELQPAEGESDNPLFAKQHVKDPLIAEQIEIPRTPVTPTFLYDLKTEAGKVYRFTIK